MMVVSISISINAARKICQMKTTFLVESLKNIHRETVCLNQCYIRRNKSNLRKNLNPFGRLRILSCQKHKIMGPRNRPMEHNKLCGTAGIPVSKKNLTKFMQFISLIKKTYISSISVGFYPRYRMLLVRKKPRKLLGNPKVVKVNLDIQQKSISASELTICQNSLLDFCFNILVSHLSYSRSLEIPSHSPPL